MVFSGDLNQGLSKFFPNVEAISSLCENGTIVPQPLSCWFTAVRLLLSFQFPLFCNKEKSPLRRCVLCRQIEKEANMAGRSGDFLVLFFTCPFELWPKLLLKQALHWLKHLKCFFIALFEPIKSFVYVLDKDSVKYQPRNFALLVEWLTASSDGNHSKSKRWTIFFK